MFYSLILLYITKLYSYMNYFKEHHKPHVDVYHYIWGSVKEWGEFIPDRDKIVPDRV